MEASRVEIEVYLKENDALASAAAEVRRGLSRRPKLISPKFFYDARGSVLFEEITRLPEYYLTRAEQSLLRDSAREIAEETRPADLVELGAGSAAKTRILIEACRDVGSLRRYVPLEVSAEMAEESARGLASDYPWLFVHAVVGDFERDLDRLPRGDRRLVLFLGSTLGNFTPERARTLLRNVGASLEPGDWFLLGTDLVKDKATLDAAYNDSMGITAEFNRNSLRVLNRRYRGDFEPSNFEHVAFYDPGRQRVEMHLRSRKAQTVTLEALDLSVDLDKGETIQTEVSCKYTRESVQELLSTAGMKLSRWYSDGIFALSLARSR